MRRPAATAKRRVMPRRIKVERRKAPRGLPADMCAKGLHMGVYAHPPEKSINFVNPVEPAHAIGVAITPAISMRKNVQRALAKHAETGRHQLAGDLVIGLPTGMEKAKRVLLANERVDESVTGTLTDATRMRKLRSHQERDAVRGLIARSAGVPVQVVGDRFYYHNGRFYTYANFTVAPVAEVTEGVVKYASSGKVPLLQIRNPRAIAILREAMERKKQ